MRPVVHTDRQTDARTDKVKVESTDGQTDIHAYTTIHTRACERVRTERMKKALLAPIVHMDTQTDAQTDNGTVESTDGQTDRQTDRHTCIHNYRRTRVRARTHRKNEKGAASPGRSFG